jgi:hypothetical protein
MRRRTIVAVALLAILVLFVGGLVIYSAGALSRVERVEARIDGRPRTLSWLSTRRPPRPSA